MDLNEAIRSLAQFILHLSFDDQLGSGVFKDSTVLISRGDHTIILAGDDADRYGEILSSIYQAISERERPLSKRAVSNLVADFFIRALKSGDHLHNPDLAEQLDEEERKLKAALFEKPKIWEVQLLVEGLAPSGLPLTVGQVSFGHLDKASLSNLKKRVVELINNSGALNREAVVADLSTRLDVLQEKTVAVVSVNAVDNEAAILSARRKVQITIDAINFFSPRERLGGWAFLPGDTMPQSELVLAFCEDGRLTPSFRRAGPIRKIPLDQIATRKGFARVSDMLAKEVPTGLEEKILAALQWAGRAQVEARPEEAFLLYAIALESLLLRKDLKAEISHRLAVRCAHLGGGPTLEDKKRVVQQILSLYQIRSNIVHSGTFLVSEAELELIREYSVSTLLIVINAEPFRDMTEVKEFEGWFETQLLSGGISPT